MRITGGSWYGSEIETDAFYLKLLARTDPKGELAPRLVKYLLNNRKHGTLLELDARHGLLHRGPGRLPQGQRRGPARHDGRRSPSTARSSKEVKITPADLFTFDNGFVLEGEALATGEHTVSFVKTGQGPALLQRLPDQLHAGGSDHARGPGDQGRPQGLPAGQGRQGRSTWPAAAARRSASGSSVIAASCWPTGATLKSGDLVEVELEIDSKNDYEYLVFEDFKAAGFEPVEVRSGYNGNDLGAYVEFRDERVAFFARTLARGKHSVSYRLRAEIPGRFHALPARAQAMYAPELRANSDEIQLRVED